MKRGLISSKIKFKYRPWQGRLFPIAAFKLQSHSTIFLGIVDSGAETCLFPAEYGRIVGINVESGTRIDGGGAKHGAQFDIYCHDNVEIDVAGHRFKTTVGFSWDVKVPLLGRKGFFEKFKVKFDERKKEFSLTPYSGR